MRTAERRAEDEPADPAHAVDADSHRDLPFAHAVT
jgi:hypothetical protein